MNSHNHALLDDVLADVAPDRFREQLFQQTLQTVQRRRRLKTTGRILAFITLASLPFMTINRPPHRAEHPLRRAHPTVSIISTEPFQGQIVLSRTGSIPLITSTTEGCLVLRSQVPEELFKELDDTKLLDLLADQGAVGLVRNETENATLLWIFPDAP